MWSIWTRIPLRFCKFWIVVKSKHNGVWIYCLTHIHNSLHPKMNLESKKIWEMTATHPLRSWDVAFFLCVCVGCGVCVGVCVCVILLTFDFIPNMEKLNFLENISNCNLMYGIKKSTNNLEANSEFYIFLLIFGSFL